MRIVKCEKIFISQEEDYIWEGFDKILEDIERGSEDLDIKNLIVKIRSYMFDLANIVEIDE